MRQAAAFLAGTFIGLFFTYYLSSPAKEYSRPIVIHDAAQLSWQNRAAAVPAELPSPPPPPPHLVSDGLDQKIFLGGVGPFNLDSRRGLRDAVAARTVNKEIATFTSNLAGLSSAANMALQLRRFGHYQHMVLGDTRETCLAGRSRYPWLGCGWSSGLPGFEEKYANGIGGSTAKLWSLWSAKWLLVARLTELRVNVLALDTDMMLQADPYPLLHSHPMDKFHMVIVPEGSRVNLGFIYVRGVDCKPAGGTASVLWDVVRRLRLFTEDWPLLDRRGKGTSTYGLWDQGLFTDAITSAVAGSLVYPYTYLQSPKTGVWKDLKWPPESMSVRNLSRMHVVHWRDYGNQDLREGWLDAQARKYHAPTHATRPKYLLPPIGHPQRKPWAEKRDAHGRNGWSLLWAPMHVLNPLAHLRKHELSAVTPGWLESSARPVEGGAWPLSSTSSRVSASAELLLATPDWLYCLVGRWAITAGWPSLYPRSICAVLHLVECRSQFGMWNANKAARPYVQRALGYWLLPEPPLRPLIDESAASGGPGKIVSPGAIRLSRGEWDMTTRSLGALLNALQRLALYAAITGRSPVIPSIPCASKWISRNAFGRGGLADDYVLQLPNRSVGGYHKDGSDGGIECHLALGGQSCMLPKVLPAWTQSGSKPLSFLHGKPPEDAPAAQITATFTAAAGQSVRCGGKTGQKRRLTLELDSLREASRKHENAPMLEVTSKLDHRDAPAVPWRCRGADAVEATLSSSEAARLSALQSACEGFFGERGTARGQLDWLHRKRLKEK